MSQTCTHNHHSDGHFDLDTSVFGPRLQHTVHVTLNVNVKLSFDLSIQLPPVVAVSPLVVLNYHRQCQRQITTPFNLFPAWHRRDRLTRLTLSAQRSTSMFTGTTRHSGQQHICTAEVAFSLWIFGSQQLTDFRLGNQ